jgi:two-component system, OmpR family, response regulator MprA
MSHAVAPATKTRAVLIVDDDAALLRTLRLTLSQNGFGVRLAENGRTALQSVMEQEPDAVVLDLEMPEVDGRTFYRQLRERGVDVPVLILSAHGARAAGRELGTPAMDKPFNPDELVKALHDLLP